MGTAAAQPAGMPWTARRRGRYFFFGAALLMLTMVVVGFSPTFYLRGFVTAPIRSPLAMPAYLFVHGCVMTAWCLFIVLQTWLAASGRTDLHRRMGAAGCVLLAAVVLTALYATLHIVRRGTEAGFSAESALAARANIVLFANLSVLPCLVGLATAAILLRRRREWHGRLMYWVFVLSIGPAFGGGGTRLIEPFIARFVSFPGGIVATLVALAALIVHDLHVRRRVHPATLAGGTIDLLAPIPGVVFAASNAGRALFVSLG